MQNAIELVFNYVHNISQFTDNNFSFLQIKAFSMAYKQPVEVIQGHASAQLIGEEFSNSSNKPLVIT